MVTMLDNQIIINKEYIIQSYEILDVNLKLNESANIYLMIFIMIQKRLKFFLL